MPRGKSRERSRADYTLDNGRNRDRNAKKETYNVAVAAVDEYNFQHPGTNLSLETLNDTDVDPHNEHDIQIPITFTHCNNITRMSQELSEYAGTDCFLSYVTTIDVDDVLTQHILHVDRRGLRNRQTRTQLALQTLGDLPPIVRLLLVLLTLCLGYAYVF